MSETTLEVQPWTIYEPSPVWLRELPEELRGLDWVRVLAYAVDNYRATTDYLSLNRYEDWAEFYRSSAPAGLFTCSYFDVEGWKSLRNKPEIFEALETSTLEWASSWCQRLSNTHPNRWGYFGGDHKLREFVRQVSAIVNGWEFSETHHFAIGSLILCPDCDEIEDTWSVTNDTDRRVCDDCLNNSYYWSHENESYYEYRGNAPEHLNSYEDHPLFGENKNTLVRLGSSEFGMFYGFELEIENENHDRVRDALDLLDGGVYRVHDDGSLHNGIEVVSYPMSGQFIREKLNLDWLRQFARRGWRSWDADGDTCGLHIHASRDGFSSDVHLFAFASFIYANERQMTTLAGRHSNYGSFSHDKRPPLALDVKKRAQFSERYVAVNLTNDHTAEVRIFKGSLNERRVRSALELVSGAVEFTRPLTIRDLNLGAINWSAFVDFIRQTPDYFPNLISLIETKGI